MSHNTRPTSNPSVNPVALSSYSVAICSFAASVLGMGFSHWPSGALAGVGGFYLVVGFFSRVSSTIAENRSGILDISRQTSGADNLVAEAVGEVREPMAPALRSAELVGAQH